jgi:hypothetical protein
MCAHVRQHGNMQLLATDLLQHHQAPLGHKVRELHQGPCFKLILFELKAGSRHQGSSSSVMQRCLKIQTARGFGPAFELHVSGITQLTNPLENMSNSLLRTRGSRAANSSAR